MRALNKCEKGARDSWKDAFKKVAEPIAADVRSRLGRFEGASVSTVGPRVVTSGVFITQRKRKVTGLRGDFGSLQMRVGFLPSLEAHEDDVERAVERAFDDLADSAGF